MLTRNDVFQLLDSFSIRCDDLFTFSQGREMQDPLLVIYNM